MFPDNALRFCIYAIAWASLMTNCHSVAEEESSEETEISAGDENEDSKEFDMDGNFTSSGLRNYLAFISESNWSDVSYDESNSLQECGSCQCMYQWLAKVLFNVDIAKARSIRAYYDMNINISAQTVNMAHIERGAYNRMLTNVSSQIDVFEARNGSSSFLKNCNWRAIAIARNLKVNEIHPVVKLNAMVTTMKNAYSTSVLSRDERILRLHPDLNHLMASSRDYFDLLWAWEGWHDVAGQRVKDTFVDSVEVISEKSDHFNIKYTWKYIDGIDIKEMMTRIMEEIRPLYRELHAFVRARLVDYYSSQVNGTSQQNVLRKDGPIPAHILGKMDAKDWSAIEDICLPFPDHPLPNVTHALISRNFTVKRMFELAEEFFVSLGFQPMTDVFWTKSVMERPNTNVNISCHPSSFDVGFKNDFRIKMCGNVDDETLRIIYHEMGHIVDFMEQRHLPSMFRRSPLREVTGDTVALSSLSLAHLQTIGLIDMSANIAESTNNSDLIDLNLTEVDINFLMREALMKIAFLPFSYSLEFWRYELFEEKFNSSEYNDKWWEIRKNIQGIVPPVNRSSEKFDPGAKYHIPSYYPYSGYFLAFIVQFQFHEILCKEAGHSDFLHNCNIYASQKAGEKLRSMLMKGSSISLESLMIVMTGQPMLSASSLLRYFEPLYKWLRIANANNTIGW